MLRKTQRNTRIIRLRREGRTLAEIGAYFKISRERVRQILARSGVVVEQPGTRGVTSRTDRADAREQYRDLRRQMRRRANGILDMLARNMR